MVYYNNPNDRAAQSQEYGNGNAVGKTLTTPAIPDFESFLAQYNITPQQFVQISRNGGTIPGMSQPDIARPTQNLMTKKTPGFGDQLLNWGKNTAIKQGAKYGGEQLGDAFGLEGGGKYGTAIYDLYNTWSNKNSSTKDKLIGTGAAGASAAGVPGVGETVAGIKVLGSNASDAQKAKALTRLGEDAAAGVATGGISNVVQLADRKFLGGQTDKLRDKIDEVNPFAKLTNKTLEKGIGFVSSGIGGLGGGKSGDQLKRDAVREQLNNFGFFGDKANKGDFTLENADGTNYNLEKDGGARNDAGRRMMELDFSGKQPPVQAKAIAFVDPLAYLITGGDKALGTDFSGYFTNTIMQGKGGQELGATVANARDKYMKAGFETAEQAQAGIKDLIDAGKIDPQKGAVFMSSIAEVFGKAPPGGARTGSTGGSGGANNGDRKPSGKGKRRPARSSGKYTPQTYEPTVLAPTSGPSTDDFAQSLADIYLSNQGLGL